MATIKLKGELHPELQILGLRAGNIIKNASYSRGNKSMNFEIFHVITNHCVVWQDNYEVIELSEYEKLQYDN